MLLAPDPGSGAHGVNAPCTRPWLGGARRKCSLHPTVAWGRRRRCSLHPTLARGRTVKMLLAPDPGSGVHGEDAPCTRPWLGGAQEHPGQPPTAPARWHVGVDRTPRWSKGESTAHPGLGGPGPRREDAEDRSTWMGNAGLRRRRCAVESDLVREGVRSTPGCWPHVRSRYRAHPYSSRRSRSCSGGNRASPISVATMRTSAAASTRSTVARPSGCGRGRRRRCRTPRAGPPRAAASLRSAWRATA
jgi:hypothetical protein